MNIEAINNSIQTQKALLESHSAFGKIQQLEDLQCFVEHHIYAAWDFMSLLKALQTKLTCATTPWFPTENAQVRYLINKMVLAEESNYGDNELGMSHYESYVKAMDCCNADTTGINHFLSEVQSLHNIFVAIKRSNLHPSIKSLLDFTFRVIEEGKTHEIAAALLFGRINLYPTGLIATTKRFQLNNPVTKLAPLVSHFERNNIIDNTQLEADLTQILIDLCGNDVVKWNEVQEIAVLAVEKQLELLAAIEEHILMKSELV
ncbi:DUF3050 domain-containing protein [Flavobacterium sp. TMP13]|uniref:DUF3050 domain-containing protein n=1 Tax=Flavobacterium sp. TMP13 TaxID=3425950 RepID=UPI003D780781